MEKKFAKDYADFELYHWWFRARRKILRALLLRVDWKTNSQVLEIGAGTGTNLYNIYPPRIALIGVEPDIRNVEIASAKGKIKVYAGTIENLPYEIDDKIYDYITMFDVLEHVKDDLGALKIINNKLNSGGKLILTVPSYKWLWNKHDIVNHHYRRYTSSNLKKKLEEADFKVIRATYFNTFLFPLVVSLRLISKIIKKIGSFNEVKSDFEYSFGVLDRIFYLIFSSERWLLNFLNFPFGSSIFVVAQKKIQ